MKWYVAITDLTSSGNILKQKERDKRLFGAVEHQIPSTADRGDPKVLKEQSMPRYDSWWRNKAPQRKMRGEEQREMSSPEVRIWMV
jgi:hypothetical protein